MDMERGSMFGPPPRQSTLISLGNETFDKFLGGGFINSSLNLFERIGPSSKLLDSVWNKSFAASTLTSKNNLIFIDFDVLSDLKEEQFLASLPLPRKVKSEILYKDIRGKSALAKIKIAWRYLDRDLSPTDSASKTNQIDFGLSLSKETELGDLGKLKLLNVTDKFTMGEFFCSLESSLSELKGDNKPTNIIIKNLLHPFSPMINKPETLLRFMYALRCYARTLEKGAILVSYDCLLCDNHSNIKQYLYNLSDCVVSFYSYETGENKLTGYKNADGTLEFIKVPKINSFGLHFQQELSDWGYRFTKNHRFFVIDELSLPPCHDDDNEDKVKKQSAADLTKIGQDKRLLEQVGPLEDFREVAVDIIAKRL